MIFLEQFDDQAHCSFQMGTRITYVPVEESEDSKSDDEAIVTTPKGQSMCFDDP